MNSKRRMTALALCACMLLVLFTSSAYIMLEADHHCLGEDCEICANILNVIHIVNSFALLGAVLLLLFTSVSAAGGFAGDEREDTSGHPTLIRLKVRLNN